MTRSTILAALAALLLPGCGLLGGYSDLAPGVQTMTAVSIVHARELDALATSLPEGTTVTPEQAAKLRWSAIEAGKVRDHALELDRLVKGGEQ